MYPKDIDAFITSAARLPSACLRRMLVQTRDTSYRTLIRWALERRLGV